MRPRLLVLLLVLPCLTAFAPAPLPRHKREAANLVSLPRLAGKWRVVSMWRYGASGQIDSHITYWKEIRVQDGKWSFCQSSTSEAGPTYALAVDGRQPARIDFMNTDGKAVVMTGVARFQGDVLEVLYHTSGTDRDLALRFENPPADYYLFKLKKTS